jgi:hypothetical protein
MIDVSTANVLDTRWSIFLVRWSDYAWNFRDLQGTNVINPK